MGREISLIFKIFEGAFRYFYKKSLIIKIEYDYLNNLGLQTNFRVALLSKVLSEEYPLS